jgi:biotin carboxyl carrier protein
MPSYETQVDGKPRQIELTKMAQNTFAAKIDGKPCKITLETDRIDPEQALTIKIDEKTYKVKLPKIEQEKTIAVEVEEATFKVEVKTPSRKQVLTSFEPAPTSPARKAATSKQATAEGAITAPMTGKIVSVKVKKGDTVKANQVLCIIEAMKMENEITALRAGAVQEVNIEDGQPVNEGETLFIVA